MRIKTKQKIIDQTIGLFNEHGFANVTTQQIAETVGISLGNLTYHFKKKEDLAEAIYRQLVIELRTLFSSYRKHPDFLSIDAQLRAFYKFQTKYCFFYVDTLEIGRAYPKIRKQHEEHISMQIQDVYNIFIFNVGKKNLRNDVPFEIYESVAHSVWMMAALWTYQLQIRGKMAMDSENAMMEKIWNLIRPYFTPQGKLVYEDFPRPIIDKMQL